MGKASRRKAEKRAARPPAPIADTVKRLEDYLGEIDARAPLWTEMLTRARAERVDGEWPDWCLLPIRWSYALCVEYGLVDLPTGDTGMVPAMAAFHAWKQGRSIYRIDPELAQAVVDTDMSGEIPVGILYYLPEWGIYLDRPDVDGWPEGVLGVLVHLDWDEQYSQGVLRLLFDTGTDTFSIPLHLTSSTIAGMLETADEMAQEQADRIGVAVPEVPAGSLAALASAVRPVVAIVLYLCSRGSDIVDPDRPDARPVRRQAPRTGPVRQWDVGYRIGTALRAARLRYESSGDGTGASPPPGLRRAHWHIYHSGPGSRSDPSKRISYSTWLPPIPIGVDPMTVIRDVR